MLSTEFVLKGRFYLMRKKTGDLLRVLETPLANVEPLRASSNKFFRVEGGVPGFELYITEDDVVHRQISNGLGQCFSDGGRKRGHWYRC